MLRNAMGWGEGVSAFPEKHYEGVRFNVISDTWCWVGVKFPEKNRYVTLQRPRRRRIRHSCCMCGTVNRHNFRRSAREFFFLSNNQCSVHGTFFKRLILGYGLDLKFWVVIAIIVSLTVTLTLITTLER